VNVHRMKAARALCRIIHVTNHSINQRYTLLVTKSIELLIIEFKCHSRKLCMFFVKLCDAAYRVLLMIVTAYDRVLELY
jgi:hypothetical protein